MSQELFERFRAFYDEGRCPHAPADPARAFGLAVRLWQEADPGGELLGQGGFYVVLCETLAGRRETSPEAGGGFPGVFRRYDPSRYRGKKATEEHFLLFLADDFKGRVRRAVRKAARPRPGPPEPERWRRDRQPRRRTYQERRRLADLDLAIERLAEQDRRLVAMKFWEGMSNRDIAALLGGCHATAGKRLNQALLALEQELARLE